MSNKLPSTLIKKLEEDPFLDKKEFSASQEASRPASVRLHPRKPVPEPWDNIGESIPWCADGFYLNNLPNFSTDPRFHAGCYYPQEASSMFVSHLITQLQLDQKPVKALDLCAATGGNATLLNSALHEDSLLVFNEMSMNRVATLAGTLGRWGYTNTIVTNNDPSAFSRIQKYFDVMFVDAPCSGSGVSGKDRTDTTEWLGGAAKLCSERQKQILSGSLDCLRPGGTLFYSTRSHATIENEEIIDWLISTQDFEAVHVDVPTEWNIEISTTNVHKAQVFRFLPPHTKSGTLFVSAIRKKGHYPEWSPRRIKYSKPMISHAALEKWLVRPEQFTQFSIADKIGLFPKGWHDDFHMLESMLNIKRAGLCVGKFDKREELIPHHELALSLIQNPSLPKVELNRDLALQYLRRQQIHPDTEIQGWALACYGERPLGWIKVLQDRTNNYYPKESQI